MKAIKQILKVKNGKISLTLPDDFDAEEVEIIVLSKEDDYELPDDFELSEEQKAILDERLMEPDENYTPMDEFIAELGRRHEIIRHSKENDLELSDEQKAILDERLMEPDENYISAKESLERLKRRHEV